MSATATPYGFKPVNEIGGLPYAGSTRQIKIASSYGSNIFYGQVVSIVAAGTIEVVTTNGNNSTPFPAGTVGVFVGCTGRECEQHLACRVTAADAFLAERARALANSETHNDAADGGSRDAGGGSRGDRCRAGAGRHHWRGRRNGR